MDETRDPSLITHHVPGTTPGHSALTRLTGDLDRWGTLFLKVARTKEAPVVEQILGGLVEWMGNELLNGWLYLPIPLFDELSRLSEDLFRACEGYLAWVRRTPRPIPDKEGREHEQAIQAVLVRVRALPAREGCG